MPHNRSGSAARGQHVRSFISKLTVRRKFWLEVDGEFAIGEHGIALLRAIQREGSLAGGASALGWSYRHAWGYVRRAERVLGTSLIATRAGKGVQRGAELTRDARRLITVVERRVERPAVGQF
jgi:molybdate transport system regulatory protein